SRNIDQYYPSYAPRRERRSNQGSDWVHDRFEDEDERAPRRGGSGGGGGYRGNTRGGQGRQGVKLRIDNLHYDLTEDDLRELFQRKGQVSNIELLYDRQDRSRGTAYVTYYEVRDARDAIRDFDGANANGQPIRLTMMPTAPPPKPRNPFDYAERPSRSLFDRIESPINDTRSRSDSPRRNRNDRRSDTRGGPPDGIDRYIPGERNNSRRRSPLPRRGEGRRGGSERGTRRPGERRRRSPEKDGAGHAIVGGRPKKTQEELDAEMEDYWGAKEDAVKQQNGNAKAADAAAPAEDDIDMIE
ncbi:RNA-binding domain-containing protein, partial [Tothia fuscella]